MYRTTRCVPAGPSLPAITFIPILLWRPATPTNRSRRQRQARLNMTEFDGCQPFGVGRPHDRRRLRRLHRRPLPAPRRGPLTDHLTHTYEPRFQKRPTVFATTAVAGASVIE